MDESELLECATEDDNRKIHAALKVMHHDQEGYLSRCYRLMKIGALATACISLLVGLMKSGVIIWSWF